VKNSIDKNFLVVKFHQPSKRVSRCLYRIGFREKGSGFKDGVLEVERNGVVLLKENTREMETGGGGECENKRERHDEEPKFTVIFPNTFDFKLIMRRKATFFHLFHILLFLLHVISSSTSQQ
jgi:hypothetical protein